MITNTHSVGVVRDAVVEWIIRKRLFDPLPGSRDAFWALPVVAETYDGRLNDVNGFHVKKEHAFAALDSAATGKIAEGNVGGGTGMVCHGFKGGIGTASRKVTSNADFIVAALVQANYGSRRTFTVAGVPVGQEITDLLPETQPPTADDGAGSIIVVIATDAPLLPHQLKRLARRVPIGIARVGGHGDHYSGDIFIAFSTANPGAAHRTETQRLTMIPNDAISSLLEATAQATEEAILNALVAAETMTGANGNKVYALPHDRLKEILKRYGR
jgi:L-aminopeptidase/D-esterase-like protein